MKKENSVLYSSWKSSACVKVQAIIFSSTRRTSRNLVHQSLHFHKAFSVNLLLVCICADKSWSCSYHLFFQYHVLNLITEILLQLQELLLPWQLVSVTADDLLRTDSQHETSNLLRSNTKDPDSSLLLLLIIIRDLYYPQLNHQDSCSSTVAGAMHPSEPSACGTVLSCGPYLQVLQLRSLWFLVPLFFEKQNMGRGKWELIPWKDISMGEAD